MTREEREKAIKILKSKMDGHTDTSYEWAETVRMAIEALEQYPCEDAIECFDTIYRLSQSCGVTYDFIFDRIGEIETMIKALPPVTPRPRMGQWTRKLIRNEYGGCIGAKMIYSECEQDNGYDKRMKFCPNCGAKMKSEE